MPATTPGATTLFTLPPLLVPPTAPGRAEPIPVPRTAGRAYERAPDVAAWLNTITDPEQRLQAAQEIAGQTQKQSQTMIDVRAFRVYAIRTLIHHHYWTQIDVTRWLGITDRTIASQAIQRETDLRFGARPARLPVPAAETETWAKTLAREAHNAYRTRMDAGVVARAVRQDLIRAMVASGRWTNADLADLTGLTTTSIAQIKLGTANPRGKTGRR